MKKYFISIFLIFSLLVFPATSFADTNKDSGDWNPVIEEVWDNSDCKVIDSSDTHPLEPPITNAPPATMWKIESKKLVNDSTYGTWTIIDETEVPKKDAPQDIKCAGHITYSHSISGELRVSTETVNTSLNITLSQKFKVSSSARKKNAGAGNWYFKVRHVNHKY